MLTVLCLVLAVVTLVALATHVDDWRDEVIYQVLVDRFENGDVGNDFLVNNDDLARYQGGDWQGLIDRMGYLQDLGVTTLWISPVVRNVETDANVDGYHGYWAQDWSAVNPHFGTLATLQELVREAHRRDMKVIIDIVTNHVGQAFFYDMNLNGVADINFQNNGGPMPVRHYTEYDPDFNPAGIQAFTSLGESGGQAGPTDLSMGISKALFEFARAGGRRRSGRSREAGRTRRPMHRHHRRCGHTGHPVTEPRQHNRLIGVGCCCDGPSCAGRGEP